MSHSRKGLKGLKIRSAEREDVPALYACQRQAYAGMAKEALCSERLLALQQSAFPEGVQLAEYEGVIVGYATCLIVQLDDDSPWYAYDEITGGGAFTTHNPNGDTLYGADIAVLPEFRGRGVASALYRARKKLLRRLNLKRMVAGGRIPGYEFVSEEMTPQEYVNRVIQGELVDPSLNAHLKAGYDVRGVHHGYLEDEQSLNYATFLEYKNPHFKSHRHRISVTALKRRNRKVRVCLAQTDFTGTSFEAMLSELTSLFEEAEALGSQLVVLPDAWRQQLHAESSKSYHTDLSDFLRSQCHRLGLYVACGSLPDQAGSPMGMFGPSGDLGMQSRLHLPAEVSGPSRSPSELLLFDTPLARIGLLAGYDLLFPEISRRLTLAGLQLLLCAVDTRERNDYLRLRYCAQARAVENSIYVALCNSGCSRSYGESAIFTPCDFGFPDSGIAARAGTFGPTFVLQDLDLGSLESVREFGAVTPLKDRRIELCGLSPQGKVRTVKCD